MISFFRKVVYVLYGKDAEERQARRLAEETAAKEREAERQRIEELHRQNEIAEKRALEVEAAERHRVQELANQKRVEQQRAAWEAIEQRRAAEEAARQKRLGNPFQVGERYKNHKGLFTVIGLTESQVCIRWDSGEEFVDTIESQQRILRNMERGPYPQCSLPVYDTSIPCDESYQVRCALCGRPVAEQLAQYHLGKPYGSTCIGYVTES